MSQGADEKQTAIIPSWDGNPRTFNKYKTLVEWCVSGTRQQDRRYVVGRLLPKLSGPSGLLVSKWRARDFENDNGVDKFLQKLSKSPLPKQALQDAFNSFERCGAARQMSDPQSPSRRGKVENG